jgi:hypothetical protein
MRLLQCAALASLIVSGPAHADDIQETFSDWGFFSSVVHGHRTCTAMTDLLAFQTLQDNRIEIVLSTPQGIDPASVREIRIWLNVHEVNFTFADVRWPYKRLPDGKPLYITLPLYPEDAHARATLIQAIAHAGEMSVDFGNRREWPITISRKPRPEQRSMQLSP